MNGALLLRDRTGLSFIAKTEQVPRSVTVEEDAAAPPQQEHDAISLERNRPALNNVIQIAAS